MKKCRTCPYRLGIVKCTKNPCPACIGSKRKTNPFEVNFVIKNSAKNKLLIQGGKIKMTINTNNDQNVIERNVHCPYTESPFWSIS